jgi:two-component system, sensor histidine kinase and response regulator
MTNLISIDPSGSSPRRTASRNRWHLAYFLLAAFDLLTVSGSLYLNHRLTTIYADSVAANHRWAERLGDYSALGQLAGAVNAPGNDVFDSRDVAGESARMAAALHAFTEAARESRAEIVRNLRSDEAAPLLRDIDQIGLAMKEMTAEADLIFSQFASGQPARAGERMASMDRKYAMVNAAFATLSGDVRQLQNGYFQQQVDAAAALKKVEHLIAGLVVFMVVGAIVYGHNIAKQMHWATIEREKHLQALRDSELRTRTVIESALDAVVVLDAEGLVTGWNRNAEETFGWTAAEAIGHSLSTLIVPEQYREAHENGMKRFLATGQGQILNQRIEIAAVHRHGHQFPIELTISALRMGDEWMFSAFLRDITDRKEVEQTLQRAKETAEAANRAKSEFLANMSHEIRTPMNGVIGMTELALDTPLTADQREYLTLVKDSADSLLAIINDILDFSKIEAGKLELDPVAFSLRDMVESTVKALALRAHEKGLELVCRVPTDIPDGLIGDANRLRQVLVNLIGNAVKFTDRGEVLVSVECSRQQDSEVLLDFAVVDTGIGIAADKQAAVFEPFTQADGSTTRKHGGTGLGLSISSNLVQLMGGTMRVASIPGEGSTFEFSVPFCVGAARTAVTDTSQLNGLRVLVVDDNRTNRMVLTEMVRGWGMRPTAVDGGDAAIDALSGAHEDGESFRLVLLDLNMPGMNGFTVAERIRTGPRRHEATIIMLASSGQHAEAARCRELGVAQYLVKPVKQSDLLQGIIRALVLPGEHEPVRAQLGTAVPVPSAIRRPSLRVLLAEDNIVNQTLAKRVLEAAGHTVRVAATGVEALAALDEQHFDAVLMDVQMPVMGGLEATAAIRDRERGTGRHLPIIGVTAHALTGDRERCLAAGMDDYIAKPIQPKALTAMLAGLVPSNESDVSTAGIGIVDA